MLPKPSGVRNAFADARDTPGKVTQKVPADGEVTETPGEERFASTLVPEADEAM